MIRYLLQTAGPLIASKVKESNALYSMKSVTKKLHLPNV